MTPASTESEQDKRDPILEALRGPIAALFQDDVRLAIDPEKSVQYAEIRKNEMYWRGNQYLDEVYTDGKLTDYKPINGQWHQENPDADSSGLYDTVINDVRGYGRKFIAVLAQQPPNVKCEPNDKTNEDHIRRAKIGQRVADLLHGLWKVKKQNRKLNLTYYKNGTAFGRSVFVSDEEKYGYTEEPVMEMRPTPLGPPTLNCVNCGQVTPAQDPTTSPMACPGCQQPFGPEDLREPEMVEQPQQTGTKRYANGCVEHSCESGLRVTTQFDIQELTDTGFLIFEYEEHKGRIFLLHPELRKKMLSDGGETSGGGAASNAGQDTRDIASSPSGTGVAHRKNRLLYTQCWIRPLMYEVARGTVTIPTEDEESTQSVDLRDALKKLYPTGLKITMVGGDTVVRLEEARMDDEWCMSPPEPAENAYPDPLCKDYMSVQDQTNDFANIQRQTWERAIPQLGFDTSRVDMTYQAKYRQLPGTLLPMQGKGGKLDDAFTRIPVATPEPEMEKYSVQSREHGAEIIGITPPIFGGGAKEQTAYATNLKRNQAMLQLSVPADAGRDYWCDVTYNSVMLMAKHSNGTVPSPHAPRTESEQIEDLKELLKGGFHFTAADAMPMSWPEQREQVNKMVENSAGNPQLLDLYGLTMPANIPQLQDALIGMPNWKIPNEDALAKVHFEIRELLKGKPVEQISKQTGQPMQLPSIPVDEWDNHNFVALSLQDWFCTEQALDLRKTNPMGFSNVAAFWRSHKGLAMAEQMQQAMQAAAPASPGQSIPEEKGEPQKLMPPAGGTASRNASASQ